MEEKLGVFELKDIIDGVLALEKIGVEVMKDGKVSMADLPVLMALLPQTAVAVYKAIEGADKIPAELKDLSVAEGSELVAHVVTKLSVADEKAVKIVEHALKIAVEAGLLAKVIISK